MIPKIIHYCWFGKNEKNEVIRHCIRSWNKYLPGFEIIEWNEDNFDLNINLYAKQAYDLKKYAFVTDFIRLYVLYNYGGIYLDTDVEVIKRIDKFLELEGFTGFESNEWAVTAIMGSEKRNQVIKNLLDYYTNRQFIINGEIDTTTNTVIITENFVRNYNLSLNGEFQYLKDTKFAIYPPDYFCPKECWSRIVKLTENSHTIHHFNASWLK